MFKNLLAFFLFFLFLFSDVSLLRAQQLSIIDQVILLKPSLVEITATRTTAGKINGKARVASIQNRGAGVIIDTHGIIVTNAHVVNKATHIKILLSDGQQTSAKLLRFAPELDLAFLKIDVPYSLKPAILTDSAALKLNDEVFNVGSSPLLKQAITAGRIIGLASSRNAHYSNFYESDFFETSFDLYSGDSGGPLFNREGKLVGLITAKLLSKGHSSFAISANKIARYLAVCKRDIGV